MTSLCCTFGAFLQLNRTIKISLNVAICHPSCKKGVAHFRYIMNYKRQNNVFDEDILKYLSVTKNMSVVRFMIIEIQLFVNSSIKLFVQ